MRRNLRFIWLFALCLVLLVSCREIENNYVDNSEIVDIKESLPEETAKTTPQASDTTEYPTKIATDWSSYQPLYIGTVPVGCIMVADAAPENVSDCIKSVLQNDQNYYASDYESKYIESKMVIDGVLDIYGCVGTAIFNFDWDNTLSNIVFKFENDGSFTPELFNALHDDICATLGVSECWNEQYGLHKEAQNDGYYSCSWLGDDLGFECSISCYFDGSGNPDNGMLKFDRTVSAASSHSFLPSGPTQSDKSCTISQNGLTITGTYHDVRNPYVDGTITNNSNKIVKFVKIKIALYNDGKVTDTDWTYAVGAEGLEPGESSQWKIYCSEAETIKISIIE